MAHVTAAFTEMERRRIGERTREGRARIEADAGRHMDRAHADSDAALARIAERRATGASYAKITAHLTDRIPHDCQGCAVVSL